jgi:MYXO-CTERM domain-containing protein
MDSTQDTASRQFSITIDAADPAESDGNGCVSGFSAAGSLMPALAVAFATFRRRRRT